SRSTTSTPSSNPSAPFMHFVGRRNSKRPAIAFSIGSARGAATTSYRKVRRRRGCLAKKGSRIRVARRSSRTCRASLAIRFTTPRCRARRSRKMKRIFSGMATLLIALLLTASVAIAHHSFAMFDRTIEKVATGTIVRWTFNNPHSWLYLNVKNKDGSETLWSFEGSSPTGLLQRGITGYTFEPGSTILVLYCPWKDGRPCSGPGRVTLSDGSFFD